MSDYTTTTNLNLKKPAIGGSDDKWGEYLNENLETIGTSIVNLQNASTSRSLESLSNVLDTTPTTGQLLQYDTANWKAATVTIPDDIEDLTNVTVTSPADGQVLAYSTSNSRWENQTPGAATIPDGTITNAKLDTSLQGQIALILQTTGTPTDNQILQYNSTSTNWEFVDVPGGNISTLSDTDVSGIALGNALMYNASGDWEARDIIIADVTNLQTTLDTKLESSDLSSYVTSTSLTTTLGSYVTSTTLANELADYTETSSLALGTLNNVTNTSLATNDFLVYDAVDGAWENTTPANARTALGLGTIATQDADDVTITGGNISGIVDLAIADGGTGASSVSAARTNLGLGALATQDTITESQISDLGSYITASSTDTLTNKSGNISQWTNDAGYLTAETNNLSTVSGTLGTGNGGTGLSAIGTANQVLAVNAGATALEFQTISITESQISDLQSYLTAETNDLSAAVTWANVPDANITQSSVTQHQAALSITESQISDLQTYLTAETNDLGTAVTGTLGTANGGTGVTSLTSLNAADLGSNNGVTDATDGYVLTADGTGGVAWEAATGGISDIVSDTTPQLGGNLDLNGNSIVSVSAGNIAITPDTTGKIILDGLSWPTADGSADQVLKTDGSGNLSFVDQSGGGGSGSSYIEHSSTVSDSLAISAGTNRMYVGGTTFSGSGTMEGYLVISHGYANFTNASALIITGTLNVVG
jgi:hypothetical protein